MIYAFESFRLRPIEPEDGPYLYLYKNDPEVAALLGGFHSGLAKADIQDWVDRHRKRSDEILWAIAEGEGGRCIGHVGLYKIDHRARSAEFAIMLGSKAHWNKGLGKSITAFVVEYGFSELNLNRIQLSVLSTNGRALQLYHSLGFTEEGRLRQAQFKAGHYVDVVLMAILKGESSAHG